MTGFAKTLFMKSVTAYLLPPVPLESQYIYQTLMDIFYE